MYTPWKSLPLQGSAVRGCCAAEPIKHGLRGRYKRSHRSRELSGLAAIHEMYGKLFAAMSPSPTPLAAITGTHGVAVEIEARLPDGSVRRTANFFHFNADGLIERLSVYARGR